LKLPKYIKLLIAVLISAFLLFLIYWKIDFDLLIHTLQTANREFFLIYFSLFVPQLLIAAYRWKYILKRINNYKVSYYHTFQMVTGSYTANLIVPAKMGEIVRVFWVDRHTSRYRPILVILFEKLWDILAVYLILYISLFFIFKASIKYSTLSSWLSLANFAAILLLAVVLMYWQRKGYILKNKFLERLSSLILFFINHKKNMPQIALWSVTLWIIQILQFYFMFRVFEISLPLMMVFSGSSLAILAGAIIISIGGVGPRDAALIWFYSGFVTKEILVSVGIISIFRIIVPALIGLPFFLILSFQKRSWKKTSGYN